MTDLSDVSPGAPVSSARQNLINDYIQDGTHKINTLSVDIGGSEAIDSTKNWKGVAIPGLVPIGGIIPWGKTITGTPVLPAQFVECNGQTLSDGDSPLNGQVIPNYNGDNAFLRGNSTSGATGGSANVTLTSTELPAHTHTGPSHTHDICHYHAIYWYSNCAVKVACSTDVTGTCSGHASSGVISCALGDDMITCFPNTCTSGADGTGASGSAGTGSAFSILPVYHNIVWVMRIK